MRLCWETISHCSEMNPIKITILSPFAPSFFLPPPLPTNFRLSIYCLDILCNSSFIHCRPQNIGLNPSLINYAPTRVRVKYTYLLNKLRNFPCKWKDTTYSCHFWLIRRREPIVLICPNPSSLPPFSLHFTSLHRYRFCLPLAIYRKKSKF